MENDRLVANVASTKVIVDTCLANAVKYQTKTTPLLLSFQPEPSLSMD